MLLGYFFKQIRQEAPREVRPGEPAPGSIVVAVEKMEQLRETGLPCAMRFGIVETAQIIIWQRCESEKLEEPNFKVQRMSVAEFASGMPIYECAIEGGRLRDKVLMRAQIFVGRRTRELCSYPGDDFAAECVSGLTSEEMAEERGGLGQHWWTPLKMGLKESLTWLGWDGAANKLPEAGNLQVFNQTHHGIAIEAEQVIHFSTCRVPDGSNQIKTDSLRDFRAIGDDCEAAGSPVLYKEETPEQRLSCRNRAVWVLFHAAEWGGYHLFTNNCEHFSRYCRVGKKESRQVVAAVVQALTALLAMLPRSVPYSPLIGALVVAVNRLAKITGKPTPAAAITNGSTEDVLRLPASE